MRYLAALSGWAFSPVWKAARSEEHTSELQSPQNLVCRLLLEKNKREPTKPADFVSAASRFTRGHEACTHSLEISRVLISTHVSPPWIASSLAPFFFFLMIRRPPRSTLFPSDALPISTDPIVEGGHRVVFLSSDDEDAIAPVADLAKQLGFASVKLGKLSEGRSE